MNNEQSTSQKAVAWARPVYARPVNAPDTGEWDEFVDIEFHTRPEKPEGEGWCPLVVADTGYGAQAAEIEALRAEVDALRQNAASVQPELVAVALAACDAVDELIEKWYATRESGCLPNQVVRARGASKLLRAVALECTK